MSSVFCFFLLNFIFVWKYSLFESFMVCFTLKTYVFFINFYITHVSCLCSKSMSCVTPSFLFFFSFWIMFLCDHDFEFISCVFTGIGYICLSAFSCFWFEMTSIFINFNFYFLGVLVFVDLFFFLSKFVLLFYDYFVVHIFVYLVEFE